MADKKQTAVEFLVSHFGTAFTIGFEDEIKAALEIEKIQYDAAAMYGKFNPLEPYHAGDFYRWFFERPEQ